MPITPIRLRTNCLRPLFSAAVVLFALFMPVCSASPASAQVPPPSHIEGRVRDEEGAPIRGVIIQAFTSGTTDPVTGTLTDDLGFYRIGPLDPGAYTLRAERLGFDQGALEIRVELGERQTHDFTLATAPLALEGISVDAERSRNRIRFEEEAGATVRELGAQEIKSIPSLVESDPLRAVEVLPGIVTTSDFSSAFNVRGGSADQNLILLDGLPIFNPTHMGGVFSVFNTDMIDRAELLAGGFPARFGGRVSSVLDVQTDVGDGSFSGDLGISLVSSRLALGGSLPGGVREGLGLQSARWRVAGRRSYFNQVPDGHGYLGPMDPDGLI